MYWEECDKIEIAVGKTVDEITILQNGLTDRLAQSFHQKAGLMETELISAGATIAMAGFRKSVASSILSTGRKLAVEMECVIERNIDEEINRLMPFVVSVDRIFQHFALSASSASIIKRSADGAFQLERAPLFERLRTFRSKYSMGHVEAIEDSKAPARSIYSAGVIAALLETYTLHEIFAKPDDSLTPASGDSREIKNAFPGELSDRMRRAIHEQSFARVRNLGVFVRTRFAELQYEIEAGFAEIRSLLRAKVSA